jgi:hypothetical protein
MGYLGVITAPTLIADGAAVGEGLLAFKAGKGVKALAEAAGEFCAHCLVAGTEVETPNGLVPIENIKVGDIVLAFDEQTGKLAPEPVTALIRPDPEATLSVVLTSSDHKATVFRASADHPWMLASGEWRDTSELKAGDRIRTATGIALSVKSVVATGRVEQTYNLTVDGLHTYLIGEDHVVVHNSKCFTPEQRALVELVKKATNNYQKPLTFEQAKIILEWAEEVGVNARAGSEEFATPNHWAGGTHFHFNGAHVPVTMP